MKCVAVGGMHQFPCGQCMPCRINNKRTWTHRLILETKSHPVSSFITLTYNSASVPLHDTLVPKHVQDWLKRIRKEAGNGLRYYAVGEYGGETSRPHYHIAFFGYPSCRLGETPYYDGDLGKPLCGCPQCLLVHKTWGFGRVQVASLTEKSAGYICGYTTKKMTSKHDPRLGDYKHPEFARMSLRPGIGALKIDQFGKSMLTNPYLLEQIEALAAVPSNLNTAGQTRPLGRYLRNRLHETLGHDPKDLSRKRYRQISQDLQALPRDPQVVKAYFKEKGFEALTREEKLQKARNLETRVKMSNTRKKI